MERQGIQRTRRALMAWNNRLPPGWFGLGAALSATATLTSRTSMKVVREFQFVFIVSSQAAARFRAA
jgi:hypothetical protein